ncbi:MAG: MBL fold metallo-hydrolase [Chloroflexota bacterium]|nr:MBL fold metallo-hydrolase [Chloroflexota bacterium]
MDTVLENNQQAFPRPSEQLRSVHTITDRFSQSNTYLVEDAENGRLMVVDPGYELHVHLTLHYLQHILHRSPADIDLIVLTHLHPDHTAGLAAFHAACPGAMVAASEVARSLSAEKALREQGMQSGEPPFAGSVLPAAVRRLDLSPSEYVQQLQIIDTWLKDVAGLPAHSTWRVIACPIDTPESICLYNPFSKELLCGDILRTGLVSRFLRRAGTYRYHIQQTYMVLQSLDMFYLYPLHGRPVLSQNPLKHIAEHWSDE